VEEEDEEEEEEEEEEDLLQRLHSPDWHLFSRAQEQWSHW
jgi:hypothetical protein